MVASRPSEALVQCRKLAHEYGQGDARVLALRGVEVVLSPAGGGFTTLSANWAGAPFSVTEKS